MSTSDYVKKNEGFRSKPYHCSEGKLTIGYGWNLDAGIDEHLAGVILNAQLVRVSSSLQNYLFWAQLKSERKTVLIDMCFQLGQAGLAKFKKLIAALYAQDYEKAADEILNSKYARQTPGRAAMNAKIMRSGQFPK